MRRLILLIITAGLLMLTGCGNGEAEAVAVIGGADGPTAVFIAS